jgi:cell wall-associated NlpC family hydrolase
VRRLTLALSAVLLSTAVALVVSLFALPEVSKADMIASRESASVQDWQESAGRAQYHNEDHIRAGSSQYVTPTRLKAKPPQTDYYAFYDRWFAQDGNTSEVLQAGDVVSEGSAPAPRAPAEALAAMEPSEAYSQVVDNASPQRFSARGWKEKPGGAPSYGKDYSYAWPASDPAPARFNVRIPATDYYTVYARWPAARGNNAATRFGISTSSGLKWTEVDQRRDGGMWVRLGAFEMETSNQRAVRISGDAKTEGRVVADAIMVVRGTQSAPIQGDRGTATESGPDEGTMAGSGRLKSLEVVRRARAHIGTPYRHSPPLPCQAFRSEDCSCLTKTVFSKWLTLPDDPVEQWRMGESVAKSDLLPGDLVFFKEAGEANPITHVAVYSGSDNIIHASTYWDHVVERPMEHVSGYYGAKRFS